MSQEYKLVPGARFSVVYRVNMSTSDTLEGTYRGMAAVGTETALVFETVDGISFLNASSIVVLNQLEAAPEEPRKESPADSIFYG